MKTFNWFVFCRKLLASLRPSKGCVFVLTVKKVCKFCESRGIKHRGIGPVVFVSGFTKRIIDGEVESGEVLLQKVKVHSPSSLFSYSYPFNCLVIL